MDNKQNDKKKAQAPLINENHVNQPTVASKQNVTKKAQAPIINERSTNVNVKTNLFCIFFILVTLTSLTD